MDPSAGGGGAGGGAGGASGLRNMRIGVRGRASGRGGHLRTQSSASVLHRYSAGSLGASIMGEYAGDGDDFHPLPPPVGGKTLEEIEEDERSPLRRSSGSTRSPRSSNGGDAAMDWQSMGAQILGGSMGDLVSGNDQRVTPPRRKKSGTNYSLTLDLNDSADAGNSDTMPARENLVNKFAQEIMKLYPPELAAVLMSPDSSSPTHRGLAEVGELDTSSWSIPHDDIEAGLNSAIHGIRASAARSFEAFRRSKVKADGESDSPRISPKSSLGAESKELEQELITALETELKGLRVERQRTDVKFARLKEKHGTLTEQMRGYKDELEHLKPAGDKRRLSSLVVSALATKEERDAATTSAAGGGGGGSGGSGDDAAKVASLAADVQEKAVALKSVRKQFVDVLIKQQRAEKINVELQNELEEWKGKLNEAAESLEASQAEMANLRETLEDTQRQLEDKTEEVDTLLMDHEQQRAQMMAKHNKLVTQLTQDMEQKVAEERRQKEAINTHSRQDNEQLVKEMGKMLKEAIEKSTKKSTQVETALNNGTDVTMDTKDMFKCLTCSYINASIRLVCHNCGSKRFADLRNEKERKHIRKQWVQSLVNMYLNMLEEILKTPRGEKVVQGEAKHSNRSGDAINTSQIRQAQEKIQRMLQAAATQKGRQKFSEVYPKLDLDDGETDTSGMDTATPPSRMKRVVRNVGSANKGASGFDKKTGHSDIVAAGSLVYAKWYGPEREKYPDWYEAQVNAVERGNTYIVKYQNGTLCHGVPRKDIRTRRK